jgi:hypothetical protein
MCGIFGVIGQPNTINNGENLKIAKKLMFHSEKRGKDASGAICCNGTITIVFKSNNNSKKLWKNKLFKKQLNKTLKNNSNKGLYVISGHTRMITHGDLDNSNNNQPVRISNEVYLIHNGVIVNWKELAFKYSVNDFLNKSDTVILAEVLKQEMNNRKNLFDAFSYATGLTEGANNFVMFDLKNDNVIFYSTNGSLYYLERKERNQLIFASERNIIKNLFSQIKDEDILQFRKNEVIEIKEMMYENKELASAVQHDFNNSGIEVSEFILNNDSKKKFRYKYSKPNEQVLNKIQTSIDYQAIKTLKRCIICILPETFPNIAFNEQGICSLCTIHINKKALGITEFKSKLKSNADLVIVPLSGGRDSSYALHFLKKEMNLDVLAYTYDWGFVSNSARENISRMCGKLGVEHLLLAADIGKKRANVRKNLIAWLSRPSLGMIPILMAGDKQFLTLAEKLRKENKAKVSIFAMNQYERTGFKSGFAGASKSFDKKRFHGLSKLGRLKVLSFYFKEVILNTKYLNRSLFDSILGFFSFYGVKTNYLQIFEYIDWDENQVMDTLKSEYGWKVGEGQLNSWRSGDATAGFYNYLYLRFAGLTEFDTFRSNQIRDLKLDRETALKMVESENRIQTQEFLDYLKILDLSPEFVLEKLGNKGKFATK